MALQRQRTLVEKSNNPIVEDLNFKLKPSDLLVVVGQVGSGKTTLLHAIMDETKILDGKKKVRGSIAYVEQEPFIISGTIKDNILFGKKYDEKAFHAALEAACLDHDIKDF